MLYNYFLQVISQMFRLNNQLWKRWLLLISFILIFLAAPLWNIYHVLRQAQFNAALLEAVKEHSLSRVQALLAAGADPNAIIQPSFVITLPTADVGSESVMVEAGAGDASVMKALLNSGGNVNTSTLHLHITPLMWACKSGNVSIIRLLIDRRADVYAKDYQDWTALHYAVQYDKVDAVKLLLSSNMSVKGDKTLLKLGSGLPEIDNLLIQHGAVPK